ncbi:MAG: glycosyl transferase [Roseateles depolymerans]|uniref:Glycosyl transferase n=1 Tax=Roseateles depolymerans TaxID=76731 RepID=A0A2W5DC18_9BURK|nr:MAG: glycosyl transferase [Roseateles depolymerans]
MKVSIITVAYNSGRTIADTLRSVAQQSYSNIEHIVIDGASRDNTLEEVRKHGQHVARVVSEPDQGIYDAMNKGLRLASGDIIGCLNADDALASDDTIAHLTQALHQADIVYGDLRYVDGDQPDRILRHWKSGEFKPSQLRLGWMPPHPSFYARRHILDGFQYDTQYRIAADYDFMLRCLQRPNTRIAYLPEVVVNMRSGGASNRSLQALVRKSSEDLRVMRSNHVGGLFTLMAKNLRKLPQFFGG